MENNKEKSVETKEKQAVEEKLFITQQKRNRCVGKD
jgi:hypothetical protein